jgi:hypothetical protein
MAYPYYTSRLRELTRVGHTPVYQLKVDPTRAPFFFVSGLAVDADGAPNAYAPLDLAGAAPVDSLDHACSNPAHPEQGSCWGIYKNRDGTVPVQSMATVGIPILGKVPIPIPPFLDPYPGYFISTTSLVDSSVPEEPARPRRYVDSSVVPYIALQGPGDTPGPFRGTGLKIGDLAFVINGDTGKWSYAIYADWKSGVGEGSIALAKALGLNSSPINGGADEDVLTIVFPGSGSGQGSIPLPGSINLGGLTQLLTWGNSQAAGLVAKSLDLAFPYHWERWYLSGILGFAPATVPPGDPTAQDPIDAVGYVGKQP